MVKLNAGGKKGKLLCCKHIFDRIKAKLAEIQHKKDQNVKKPHFLQKFLNVFMILHCTCMLSQRYQGSKLTTNWSHMLLDFWLFPKKICVVAPPLLKVHMTRKISYSRNALI